VRTLITFLASLALVAPTLAQPPADAPKEKPPARAAMRDILLTFQASDGYELEAKLTLPTGDAAPSKPPVVFFLHGAGVHTYDNPFAAGTEDGKPVYANFLDLHARELAARGIAFCRMSKRGCKATDAAPYQRVERAVFAKATMAVLLDDYHKCLDALRTREEVDHKRIVLLGASEGTRLGPELALRSPDGITGVVMMGYAADNARDTIEWQHTVGPWRNVQHAMPAARDGRLTRDEYDAATKANAALAKVLPFEPLDVDKDGALTDGDLQAVTRPRLAKLRQAIEAADDDYLWKNLLQLSTAYLRSWWDAEPNSHHLLALDVRLAIFHGELDGACRVEGVRETEAAMKEAGKTNLTVRIYPEANHELNWTPRAANGEVPPIYREVLDLIAGWLGTAGSK
jgi:pimeloyl-ACP methyl ester carboxylesterase